MAMATRIATRHRTRALTSILGKNCLWLFRGIIPLIRVSVYQIRLSPLQSLPFQCVSERNCPMSTLWSRRDILRGFAAIPGAILVQPGLNESENTNADGPQLEIQISPVSDHTLRLTRLPLRQ